MYISFLIFEEISYNKYWATFLSRAEMHHS